MTVRWPFKAALALLVVGLAAWVAGPRVHRAWQDRQDRQRLAAERVAMAPTARVLLQIRPPAGLRDCGQVEWTEQSGDFCWQGSQTPGQVALAIERELQRVGGTDVVGRCMRESEELTECDVRAQVGGRTWGALIFHTSGNPSSEVRLGGSGRFPPKLPSLDTSVPPEQA